jgi:hypothetical protein
MVKAREKAATETETETEAEAETQAEVEVEAEGRVMTPRSLWEVTFTAEGEGMHRCCDASLHHMETPTRASTW